MQKDRVIIAKKTLSFLENKSWKHISLDEIIKGRKVNSLKNKNDLLININRYFDYILKKNLTTLEKSSTKDMLFEVLMARLDILNNNRKSVKNIFKYFTNNPHQFPKIAPSFVESIILMATLSDINVNGLKGMAKIKGILILYFSIIYTWQKDETDGLEKTMTTLDNYLTNIEKFIKIK
tara:strand:+ start:1056 stop:1592 length:537 start_codon:yes stop_codon:yes gene_type:complete